MDLRGHPFPLIDICGKVEREVAVAFVVRALALRGDTWRQITHEEVMAVLRQDLDDAEGLWSELRRIPVVLFRGPDFDSAETQGYLQRPSISGLPGYEVTPKTLAKLRTYCRAPKPCPRCGTRAECEDYVKREGEWCIPVGQDARVDALWSCPVHGLFGFTNDATPVPVFAEAELWCVSPSGEKVVWR